MSSPEKALIKRLREIRRRHFGPRGKALFAQRLGIPLDEYERYERSTVPPGELMVRICETTGEDLQWLLTGVASRGTVVIAGTRQRHQDLLARLASILDEKPELVHPVEAFLDLLIRGEQARAASSAALPEPRPQNLIRIFEPHELPEELPGRTPGGPGRFELASFGEDMVLRDEAEARLTEPAMEYEPQAVRRVRVVAVEESSGQRCRCINNVEIARCFPGAFGMRLTDDSMRPMFASGDAVIVAAGSPAKVGRPALCRFADPDTARCRIWLGKEDGVVHLGRLADGEIEQVSEDEVLWSLEALYRLAPAA